MTCMLIDINESSTGPKIYLGNNPEYLKINMKTYRCLIFVIKLKRQVNRWILESELKDYI